MPSSRESYDTAACGIRRPHVLRHARRQRAGLRICGRPDNRHDLPGLPRHNATRKIPISIRIFWSICTARHKASNANCPGTDLEIPLGEDQGRGYTAFRTPKGGPWAVVGPRSGVCQRAKAVQKAGGCRCQRAKAVQKAGGCRESPFGTSPNLPRPPNPPPPDHGTLVRKNQIPYHLAPACQLIIYGCL